MALPPGSFQSQVNTNTVNLANPQQGSLDIGNSLLGLGRTAGEIGKQNFETQQQVQKLTFETQLHEHEAQNNALVAQQGATAAQLQQDIRDKSDELKNYPNYKSKLADYIDTRYQQFDAGFGNNDHVRNHFMPQMAEIRARAITDADIHVRTADAHAQGDGLKTITAFHGNTLLSAPTMDNFQSALLAGDTYISGMSGLSDPTRAAAKQSYVGEIFDNYGQGLINTGQYQQAKLALNSGTFDAYPINKQHLITQVRIAEDRANAVAQRQKDEAISDQKSQFQAAKVLVDAGAPVPNNLFAQAAQFFGPKGASPDPVKFAEWSVNAEHNNLAQVAAAQTPMQRDAQIDQLAALKNPTKEQGIALKWYQEKKGALDTAYFNDPVGWQTKNGNPPPALTNDPASFVARQQWVNAVSTNGRPITPLSKNELASFQEQVKGGSQRSMQVLNQLDHFDNPQIRLAAAAQIAPSDKVFQHLSQLEGQTRSMVAEGAQALHDNKQMMHPSEPLQKPQVIKNQNDAYNRLTFITKGFSPDDTTAMKSIAQQYLAAQMREKHISVEGLTKTDYANANDIAMGQTTRADGLKLGGSANWNGQGSYMLPSQMTPHSFEQAAMAYMANPKNRRPINVDGSVADLKRAYPVAIGGGNYSWETSPHAPLTIKDGQKFIIHIGPNK